MDVSDIELIRTVRIEGSLTQACAQLNMSQPTLSKKLARLEDKLEAQLFYRSSTGLIPTEVTNYILSKAEPLRDQVVEIERHVKLMTQFEFGNLNLGVGPIIEQVLLPQVLTRFLEAVGKVNLSVVTEDDETLLRMLNASEVDVIVGPFRSADWQNRNIVCVPMVQDKVIAVARHKHTIFRSKLADEARLAQFPWVAPKTQGSATPLPGSPILDAIRIVSDNYDLLKKLLLTTDAICAGPRAIFSQELEAKVLRQIDVDLSINWESSLLLRPETLGTPLARQLVSIFEKVSLEVAA